MYLLENLWQTDRLSSLNNQRRKLEAQLPLAEFALRTILRRFLREEKSELLFIIFSYWHNDWNLWICGFVVDNLSAMTEKKRNFSPCFGNIALFLYWNCIAEKKRNFSPHYGNIALFMGWNSSTKKNNDSTIFHFFDNFRLENGKSERNI